MRVMASDPPVTESPLRTQLEGAYESLEAARNRYRQLADVLKGVRSRHRLPVTRVELLAILHLEPEVTAHLHAFDRALARALPADAASTLGREVRDARAALHDTLRRFRFQPSLAADASFEATLEHAAEFASEEVRAIGAQTLPEEGPRTRSSAPWAFKLFGMTLRFATLGLLSSLMEFDTLKWTGAGWLLLDGAYTYRQLRLLKHRKAWVALSPDAGEIVLWTGVSMPTHARVVRMHRRRRAVGVARESDDVVVVFLRGGLRSGVTERIASFDRNGIVDAHELALAISEAFSLPLEDPLWQ